MDSFSLYEAQEAHDILEHTLEGDEHQNRRWHSYSVADRLLELREIHAPEVDEETMWNLGVLHDIGHCFLGFGHHAIVGAQILLMSKFQHLALQVAWHSTTEWELPLMGIAQNFEKPSGEEAEKVRTLLWAADFTTAHDGRECTLSERLSGIRSRYPSDSYQVQSLDKSFDEMIKSFTKHGLTEDHLIDVEKIK